MPHPLNGVAGWYLLLASFVVGAAVGLGFHRDDYLGGYVSLRRRLLRLGHIALAALGLVNVAYGLTPSGAATATPWTGAALLAGSIAMPAVCFLSAWRVGFRHLFFVPVTFLVLGVALVLREVPT